MFDAHLFFSTFFTLFVILDPPGLLPVFLGLTRRHTPAERASIAWRATLVALGVIVGFAVFGRQIGASARKGRPPGRGAGRPSASRCR